MEREREADVPLWRRALAYGWYIWGLSVCYSAARFTDRGLYATGVWAFERATATWPQLAVAHYRRGLIRGRELGQYRAALVDLRHASELDPEWPEPYLQAGLFKRFNGDSQGAIADLERYLALGGDDYWRIEAQNQLDQIYAERSE